MFSVTFVASAASQLDTDLLGTFTLNKLVLNSLVGGNTLNGGALSFAGQDPELRQEQSGAGVWWLTRPVPVTCSLGNPLRIMSEGCQAGLLLPKEQFAGLPKLSPEHPLGLQRFRLDSNKENVFTIR